MQLLLLLHLWYIIFLRFLFHYKNIQRENISEIMAFTKNMFFFCPLFYFIFFPLVVPAINLHLIQSQSGFQQHLLHISCENSLLLLSQLCKQVFFFLNINILTHICKVCHTISSQVQSVSCLRNVAGLQKPYSHHLICKNFIALALWLLLTLFCTRENEFSLVLHL